MDIKKLKEAVNKASMDWQEHITLPTHDVLTLLHWLECAQIGERKRKKDVDSARQEIEALQAQLAAKQDPVAELHNNSGRVTVNCLAEIPEGVTSVYSRAAPPAPVKLPKRMRIEGGAYCTAQAYYDENGDYYDRLDLLEALRAAGVEVADE